MRRADIVDYCLGKPGAWLDNPWGEEDTVAKVGDRIFCFLGGESSQGLTVKNTRELVDEWRERYPGHIGPARYLNKQLWNQVSLDGSGAPDEDEVRELIDDSYALVLAGLPKSKRP
jgi:predicted DNA-binding protein (MmcQ/YjbR family)